MSEAKAFTAQSRVLKLSPAGNRYIAMAIPKEVTLLQRRAASRFSCRLPVECSVVKSAQAELLSGEKIEGQTYDVSAVGTRIETALPLQPGDQLELEIVLFHCGRVKTLAQVVWCGPHPGKQRSFELERV